jgi:CRISPR-associated endonuclease/helicase Cas3
VRIAFVVDRRLIVDDAFERAERLCEALAWSLLDEQTARKLEDRSPDVAGIIRRVRAQPVVRHVALRLSELAGPNQPPLIARSLRGGAPREDDWARTPVQPTILCSTVDQVGSRLLFRGYGVSDRMKPIHAGLLGSDCLILLDEAHLSEPFRQTLQSVERMRAQDGAPFGFAVLTATPNVPAKRPFRLSDEDYAHPILFARSTATKPARLVEITGKHGNDTEARRAEAICAELIAMLGRLRANITSPAIAVVVNRVSRARAIFDQLRGQFAPDTVKLVIGPARAVDRDRRANELAPIRTAQANARSEMTEPLIVVATQTIEAGVDIDFDGLITEAAAFDALRQRFGRLNRAGRDVHVEGAVLAHKDEIGAKGEDPVYGDRIAKTWTKLKQLAPEPDDILDFGIEALQKQIDRETAAELAAPAANAPVLLPAYADLWSHTSPIPNADPEVALFLHGSELSPASVQIAWRADLDERADLRVAERRQSELARLVDLLKLVPPRAGETVEVPLWAARAWLKRASADQAGFSDVVDPNKEVEGGAAASRLALRWAGEDSGRTGVVEANALANGDLIVVPADYGGCDEWGWNPKSEERVTDVADAAAWPYRARRLAVRVLPSLLTPEGSDVDRNPANASEHLVAARALRTLLTERREERATALLDAILNLDLPDELSSNLRALLSARGRRLERVFSYELDPEEPPRGVVFVAPGGVRWHPEQDGSEEFAKGADTALAAVPATESDDLGVAAGVAVSLLQHCNDVRAWAASFAVRAGLPQNQLDDVSIAAFLHDPGKADPRFQTFLAGGDPYGPDISEPLAKSGLVRLALGSWERSGLPEHWRHEGLSVRLAAGHPSLALAHDRALVFWLIGTHHGYGRPLYPHADARDAEMRRLELPPELGGAFVLEAGPGPQSLAFDFDGNDWSQMFDILKSRYGIWGLARLEAFVRLADHRASEEGTPALSVRPYEEAAE